MEPKQYRNIYSLISTLLTIIAVTITILVDQELWYYTYYYGGYSGYSAYSDICFMEGPKADNFNVCYFTWSITAVGIFTSLFLFFLLSCGGNSHRTGTYVTCLGLSFIWWLAGAITDTVFIVDANDNDIEKESYRNAVMGLLWGAVGLNLLGLGLAIADNKQNKNYMPPPPPQAQFMGGAPYGGPPPGAMPYPGAGGAPYGAPAGAYPPPGQIPYGAPPPSYPPAQGYPAGPPGYPPAGGVPPPAATGSLPVWTNK